MHLYFGIVRTLTASTPCQPFALLSNYPQEHLVLFLGLEGVESVGGLIHEAVDGSRLSVVLDRIVVGTHFVNKLMIIIYMPFLQIYL